MKITVLIAVAIECKTGLTLWRIALCVIGGADRAAVLDDIGTKHADFAVSVCIGAISLEMEASTSVTSPGFTDEG